jgi:hypothetical protein
MTLAYVIAQHPTGHPTGHPGEIDQLLTAFAALHLTAGTSLAGVVQSNTACVGTHHCDMDARVLPDGPVIRISQSLGSAARGCRLDPAALEQTVAEVARRLNPETGLLIINKFGKHEAEGHGFRELIAEAMSMEVPVLVGVNKTNLEAFLEFTDGCATALQPDSQTLLAWFDNVSKSTPAMAGE